MHPHSHTYIHTHSHTPTHPPLPQLSLTPTLTHTLLQLSPAEVREIPHSPTHTPPTPPAIPCGSEGDGVRLPGQGGGQRAGELRGQWGGCGLHLQAKRGAHAQHSPNGQVAIVFVFLVFCFLFFFGGVRMELAMTPSPQPSPTTPPPPQAHRRNWLPGTLDHELGTHYFRSRNNQQQPWRKKGGRRKCSTHERTNERDKRTERQTERTNGTNELNERT